MAQKLCEKQPVLNGPKTLWKDTIFGSSPLARRIQAIRCESMATAKQDGVAIIHFLKTHGADTWLSSMLNVNLSANATNSFIGLGVFHPSFCVRLWGVLKYDIGIQLTG